MAKTDHNAIAKRISQQGTVRTAGKIEFIRDQGPVRRDIRANNFEWSPRALKNLTKILWAAQRAHSYATSALRLVSKTPSSQFSPDGMLGGRGYIQTIKDLRKSLSTASELLSSFTDTLYDEVNATHWDQSETEDSKNLLEQTEMVKQNPEGFVEDQFKSEEGMSTPVELNPSPEEYGMPEEDEDEEELEEESLGGFTQQASRNYNKALAKHLTNQKKIAGNSSLPVSTLPGPRVEHIGPGESYYGFVNDSSAVPSDDPTLSGFITDAPIYEDVAADGVTGYDNPTKGDTTYLKKEASGYSWLPGTENEIIMPYYDRYVSDADVEWMKANSKPKSPIKNEAEKKTSKSSGWIWKDV